jgi:hypothetical protein
MNEEGGSSGELYMAMFCRAFFFHCLDVLVDEGVLATHTLFAFLPACSISDGMGWIKALDGWVN